jgi:hypothetical protein
VPEGRIDLDIPPAEEGGRIHYERRLHLVIRPESESHHLRFNQGGIVNLTRSLAGLAIKRGVRDNAFASRPV